MRRWRSNLLSRSFAIILTCLNFLGALLFVWHATLSVGCPPGTPEYQSNSIASVDSIQYLIPGIQWTCLSRVCELWGAREDWGYCGAGKETEEVLVNGGHHCWVVKGRKGGKLPTKFKASFYACFQWILKVTEVTLFRTVNENILTKYSHPWVHFS